MLAWSLCDFSGESDQYFLETLFFVFFQGDPDPLSPAHKFERAFLSLLKAVYSMVQRIMVWLERLDSGECHVLLFVTHYLLLLPLCVSVGHGLLCNTKRPYVFFKSS